MFSFSYLEPVCCSMSSSNCCFLTCIQVSQEAGQVVWYSHLFQNFPQFIVIHTDQKSRSSLATESQVIMEKKSGGEKSQDQKNTIITAAGKIHYWMLKFVGESSRSRTGALPQRISLKIVIVGQTVKNLQAMRETRVQSLGQEDTLEKGMATHFSILAWKIPWTRGAW